MDQDVILGGGRKTFAIRNKVFQLFCAFAAAQLTPDGIAKGNHRAQMGFGEFGPKVASLSTKTLLAARRASTSPLTLASIQIAARQCSGKMPL